MTSLGRSPRKPKESSARSRTRRDRNKYATAGDFAADVDAAHETKQAEAALTVDDDSPRRDDAELTPEEQVERLEETAKMSALSPASGATSSAFVIDEPRPEKQTTTRRPRPAKEPKPPREKKVRPPKAEKVKAEKVKPAMAAKAPKPPKAVKTPKPPKIPSVNRANQINLAAGIIGGIGLLLSVILAVGALFIALDAAQGSAFFIHLSDLCDALVGPLKGVFHFTGVNADKKESLVGWGLGSMGYLLVGRFLQSILQARVKD